MPKNQANTLLPPIELECSIRARPTHVFRALTSQNELRKWCAPHVTMSRNKISQKKGQDVYIKLISSKEESFVRYLWRPEHWPAHVQASTITVTINDLGVSRQDTGEGLFIELVHEGWIDEQERSEQEHIWGLALESLQSLLESKKTLAWWKEQNESPLWRRIKLQELKQTLDQFKKNPDGTGKNQNFQKLWQICNTLDKYGTWYWNEEERSFSFKCHYQQLLKLSAEEMILFWKNMQTLSPFYLRDLKERLSVEQDFIFPLEEEETALALRSLQTELWLAWCLDMLQKIEQDMKNT